MVYDDANPDEKAYANLTITVRRNEKKPRFEKSDYTSQILEITPIGTQVVQVQASDEEGVSTTGQCHYQIV